MKRGDFVRITMNGQTLDCMVGLASPNSRSLMLLFDGVLKLGGGYVMGMLPVLQHDDGVYRDLVEQQEVTIEPLKQKSPR